MSAQKLGGPGARSSIPRGIDVDELLETDHRSVKRKMKEHISIFWQ